MITEKTNTAQQIIEAISGSAGKVSFMDDSALTKALMHLETKGIPSARHEDYKYCNIDALLKKDFKNIAQRFKPAGSLQELKLPEAVSIVVVNGSYSPELSDKIILKGLHMESFSNLGSEGKKVLASQADPESDAFTALNTAFSGNGFYLRIEKNEVLPMPLQIIYISSADSDAVVNPRNIIEVCENAEATIIEHHVKTGQHKVFSNYLSEKLIRTNGKLTSYTIQDEGATGYSVNTSEVKVMKDAKYDNTTFTLSGQLVRNNHNVVLDGENSEANLYGLFSTSGTQLVDNHTLMDHRVPNCQSNELYKGVISDKSTGVFNGKIYVRQDAQKTNAYQSSKNILMSDDATINTKPQLEIYANDVKCSHGTSTGKIDEDAMFYLNARGISRDSAQKILLNAFAGEVTARIEIDSLKDLIESKLGFI